MKKKYFKENIDLIINAETPELQAKKIDNLYKVIKNNDIPLTLKDKIERQLLKRWGFTKEGGIDVKNQLKIFDFMDWLRTEI